MKRYSGLFAAGLLAVAYGLAAPGAQAISLNATASAEVLAPLTITQNQTMSFGRFTPSGTAGTVTTAGAVTGGVVLYGGNQPGSFAIAGSPGTYTLTLPANFNLTGPSGSTAMQATITSPASGGRTIPGSGTDIFNVAATLAVGANQMAGLYSGTYAVTASY